MDLFLTWYISNIKKNNTSVQYYKQKLLHEVFKGNFD